MGSGPRAARRGVRRMNAQSPFIVAEVETDGQLLLSAVPSPELRRAVKRLAGYEEACAPGLPRAETPMLAVPVILTFGGSFSLHQQDLNQPPRRLARSFVAGLHRAPALVGSSGDARCVQFNLSPQAAMRLLGCDLAELVDQTVDLADIIGPEAGRLEDRLDACASWGERFAIVETFLMRRLAEVEHRSTLVDLALAEIGRSHGGAAVAEIAAHAGCSRKHLSAMVRRATGLPPKTLARVARFERAVALLRSSDRPPLARVAAEVGYADQAHFSRDFRDFAGMRPSDLLVQ